jgi:hypothetical protein
MYNYFHIRDDIRTGKASALPVDINAPVKEAFEKIGCKIAIEWINRVEKSFLCATIKIHIKKEVNVERIIKADYGMIEGWDKVTILNTDNAVENVHIKNKNLNKRKPK